MNTKRLFLIVLDSCGIGELPDAAKYNDCGSNTLRSCFQSGNLHVPNMQRLGLFNIDGIDYAEKETDPKGAFCRLQEQSSGKDTTIGHWEIAGIISPKAMPTFPDGFPQKLLDEYAGRTGHKILCNKPYSGTQVILDYGKEQEETDALIVYTSADSVFQVAANEARVPVKELYRYCEIAREMLQGEYGVGRVIARPYEGTYPDYKRTSNRHDFSLQPPRDTMCDYLFAQKYDTIGVGKITDIFAGRGIGRVIRTMNNTDGMEKTIALQKEDFHGLAFINLVDFDMLYGHRNDVPGYTEALNQFDRQLGIFLRGMEADDVLMITADHGCDPATPSTDHSREYIPCIVYGEEIRRGMNLGTRRTFADIGATVLDILGASGTVDGCSFRKEMEI